MATGERTLRTQRHLACCGSTYTFPRAVSNDLEADQLSQWNQAREVEIWAKNHRMTCPALKVTDDDAE